MESTHQEIRNEGFFIRNDKDYVAVTYQPQGPTLLINDETYQLNDKKWDVEFIAGKQYHVFVLYWEGKVKVSLRYPANLDFLMNLYHYLTFNFDKRALA